MANPESDRPKIGLLAMECSVFFGELPSAATPLKGARWFILRTLKGTALLFAACLFAPIQAGTGRCQAQEPSELESVTNSVGMTLRRVPKGFRRLKVFADLDIFQNRVQVRQGKLVSVVVEMDLDYDLFVGTHEVTVGQFRRFVEETGYVTDLEQLKQRHLQGEITSDSVNWVDLDRAGSWRDPGLPQQQVDDLPVTCVTINDCSAYCRWLSTHDGRYYRLPTRNEWAYVAACALDGISEDDMLKMQNFLDISGEKALLNRDTEVQGAEEGARLDADSYDDGFPYLAPVGSFNADRLGLFDLLGNVQEYTSTNVRLSVAVDDGGTFERLINPSAYHYIMGNGFGSPAVKKNEKAPTLRWINVYANEFIGFRIVLDGNAE